METRKNIRLADRLASEENAYENEKNMVMYKNPH